MSRGASTPEELETLLEDAFVLRDAAAVAELFEEGAVVVLDAGTAVARGREQIAGLAANIWEGGRTYVAQPGEVVQARDTGLVVGARGTDVVRRGADGTWRYAISRLSFDDPTRWETA